MGVGSCVGFWFTGGGVDGVMVTEVWSILMRRSEAGMKEWSCG